MLNQSRADLGIPDESRLLELGIRRPERNASRGAKTFALFEPQYYTPNCGTWNLGGHLYVVGLTNGPGRNQAMPQAHYINDPGHWRARAEKFRSLAEDLNNEQAKKEMLQLAKDYDYLAERAEKRSSGSTSAVEQFA